MNAGYSVVAFRIASMSNFAVKYEISVKNGAVIEKKICSMEFHLTEIKIRIDWL